MPLLKCTDEEVECAYEEFYEDVHTEFLKFGEIINFKVCKNSSPHLRGNVYVHYKSLDSAVLAYKSLNGRYFAGKQVQCEFVSLTKWRVAICGEFMRSKLKTCSRGAACNFIHCFRNPGGDYEWADWDKPPPRYWVQRMVALFGCSDESAYEIDRESPKSHRHSSRSSAVDEDRYHHFRRSQSRDNCYSRGSRNHHEDDIQRRTHRERRGHTTSKTPELLDEKHRRGRSSSRSMRHRSDASSDSDTESNMPEKERARDGSRKHSRAHRNGKLEYQDRKIDVPGADADATSSDEEKYRKHDSTTHVKESSRLGRRKDARQHRKVSKSPDDCWDDGSRTKKTKLTGDRYNREEEGDITCAEKCLTPDGAGKFGNEKSKANNSSGREGDGDRNHASTERTYRIYGSRSRKFTSKWEQEDSGKRHKNETKRKREAENSDSESRVRYLEGRSSRMGDHQFDEVTEDRAVGALGSSS